MGQPVCAGSAYIVWPMPYASLACDMTSASEVAVAAWGALQVLYAFAFAFTPRKKIEIVYAKSCNVVHFFRW